MHESSYNLMKEFIAKYLPKNRQRVLDMGSCQVKKTPALNYRDLFEPEHEYTGADIELGHNVDIVVDPYHWWNIQGDEYDALISGQMLEHCKRFWLVVQEMKRVVKKGGLICIIAPWIADKHRYPVDCWRFLPDGMIDIGEWIGAEVLEAKRSMNDCMGVFRV